MNLPVRVFSPFKLCLPPCRRVVPLLQAAAHGPMLPLDAVLPERVRRSSRLMLSAPLLGRSDGAAKGGARRARWLLITVAVAVVLLLLAVLSLVVISDCTLGSWACPLYVPPDAKNDPVLVFGGGGATWSNGTTALLIATGGVFSWACPLLDGNGLALVDERGGELVAWRPGTAEPRARVALSQLRTPVSCVQHGAFVYVACFGVEGEPRRSGIAAVRVSNWTLAKERPIGVHVHSLHVHDMSSFYPSSVDASSVDASGVSPDYAARFVVMDVGDPWETAPGGEALGGLYLLNTSLEGEATRLGAPLHARMAAFAPPPRVKHIGGGGGRGGGGGGARRKISGGEVYGNVSGGEVYGNISGGEIYVITQEPLGTPTQVVALAVHDWSSLTGVSEVSRGALGLAAAAPSDGGADIFLVGDRLFCTDRYGFGGRLFELRRSDLTLIRTAPLGAHPRYTAPLGPTGLILSASRDDSMLTALWPDTLAVAYRLPVGVSDPSFVIRWPTPTDDHP